MTVLFYIAAAIAVASTLMVITRLNAIHALLYFVVSLFAVALIFFLLGAPFIAALEVIVYAGAIMVLFIFVVMLLNLGQEAEEQERRWLEPGMWAGPAVMATVLLMELGYVLARGGGPAATAGIISPKEVGKVLLGPYLLGVELASMLLLAGLVGAYHLGRRPTSSERSPQPPFLKEGLRGADSGRSVSSMDGETPVPPFKKGGLGGISPAAGADP